MEDDWFVVIDGKPTGPHPFEELKNLNIRPGTFVKTAGMDDYKEAHEIGSLRTLLGFKHTRTLPQYYATLDIRLLAVTIDYFLVTSACSVIALIFVFIAPGNTLKIAIAVVCFILIPFVKCVYASIMECSVRQATFGKYWLGLTVCDEQGARISSGTSWLRNLSKFLSLLTLGIGFLAGFFSRKQQCLHDRIAETLVIKSRLL